MRFTLLLAAFALASPASAGSVSDSDADLVPDAYDNCTTYQNGPANACNQVDVDQDGYGNNCDPDYDNNFATTTADFQIYFDAFVGIAPDLRTDHDCNGSTTTTDFATFLTYFQNGQAGPGPSGLPCAGTIPCLP